MKNDNRPIEVYEATKGTEYNGLNMMGYTCIEGDCLYHDYNGLLAEGDYIVFSNVGSYSITMKAPFILPMADIYSIEAEEVRLERGETTLKSIFSDLGLSDDGQLTHKKV